MSSRRVFTAAELCVIIDNAWEALKKEHNVVQMKDLPENRIVLMGLMDHVKKECSVDKEALTGAIAYAASAVKKDYRFMSPDGSELYKAIKEVYENLDNPDKLSAALALQNYIHTVAYVNGDHSESLKGQDENPLHTVPGLEDEGKLKAFILSTNQRLQTLGERVESENLAAERKAEAEAKKAAAAKAKPSVGNDWLSFLKAPAPKDEKKEDDVVSFDRNFS